MRAVPTEEPLTEGHGREAPFLEIEGGPGHLSIASLKELWAFREVLWAFVVRQVKVKYRQAAIGVGWAIVQPLALAALFALFLGRIANVSSEGLPYMLFALTGLVAWSYFSASSGLAMESLLLDAGLLRKVYFPREALPIAAILAGLIDLVPGIAVLAAVSIGFGVIPGITWIALPIPLVILVLFASALGLALSSVNVYYRDVRYALPFVLQIMLFASPVVYPLSQVPASWRLAYSIVNPVATVIDDMRRIVLHHQWPQAVPTAAAFGWSVVALLLGYALFKRLERGFSDWV